MSPWISQFLDKRFSLPCINKINSSSLLLLIVVINNAIFFIIFLVAVIIIINVCGQRNLDIIGGKLD